MAEEKKSINQKEALFQGEALESADDREIRALEKLLRDYRDKKLQIIDAEAQRIVQEGEKIRYCENGYGRL